MGNLYNVSLLPNQKAINTVAILYDEFEAENKDVDNVLDKLRKTIRRLGFMQEQDNQMWFLHHGNDYSSNPKLFASAPLNVICAYLSEIFRHYKVQQIKENYAVLPIKSALLRLKNF
ncbi:hypothetical protein CW745_10600 [Psychromonas sp. psych-6C06]|uniref:hypothetical protein n=1 Tax=Psychromonas sp. psych-6C06 TaxID=2058089 RepID=UPI000C33E7CA|nr:hypothetical protein [Psychromonas sp. psych-6C06]PKF61755.1 hypothetical protein CW745_10600 [Psychromonas sp. psych-6C06]